MFLVRGWSRWGVGAAALAPQVPGEPTAVLVVAGRDLLNHRVQPLCVLFRLPAPMKDPVLVFLQGAG